MGFVIIMVVFFYEPFLICFVGVGLALRIEF